MMELGEFEIRTALSEDIEKLIIFTKFNGRSTLLVDYEAECQNEIIGFLDFHNAKTASRFGTI